MNEWKVEGCAVRKIIGSPKAGSHEIWGAQHLLISVMWKASFPSCLKTKVSDLWYLGDVRAQPCRFIFSGKTGIRAIASENILGTHVVQMLESQAVKYYMYSRCLEQPKIKHLCQFIGCPGLLASCCCRNIVTVLGISRALQGKGNSFIIHVHLQAIFLPIVCQFRQRC